MKNITYDLPFFKRSSGRWEWTEGFSCGCGPQVVRGLLQSRGWGRGRGTRPRPAYFIRPDRISLDAARHTANITYKLQVYPAAKAPAIYPQWASPQGIPHQGSILSSRILICPQLSIIQPVSIDVLSAKPAEFEITGSEFLCPKRYTTIRKMILSHFLCRELNFRAKIPALLNLENLQLFGESSLRAMAGFTKIHRLLKWCWKTAARSFDDRSAKVHLAEGHVVDHLWSDQSATCCLMIHILYNSAYSE